MLTVPPSDSTSSLQSAIVCSLQQTASTRMFLHSAAWMTRRQCEADAKAPGRTPTFDHDVVVAKAMEANV